jgi:hypothetical protein
MIPFPTDVRDPKFVDKINWLSAQQKQDQANQKTHDEYQQYAANWLAANTQEARLGHPITEPKPVPPMTVYNDDFTISHPPFPDLSAPMIDPSVAKPTTGPGFQGINPTGPTNESQAMLAMLAHIIQELDAIKAKVGA